MNIRYKWMLGLIVLLAVVAAVIVWRPRSTQVPAFDVRRSAIAQSVVATGRINSEARMDIASDVSAMVLEVPVREGDTVKAGQLLVRLQDAEAQAALAQAQAALLEAQQRVRQQQGLTAPLATQAVVQAQASYVQAQRDAERARELVAQGFFSQQKADEAQRVVDTARSALESARLQASANQDKGIEASLAASRVQQAQAAVQVAQARLDRLRISSPVAARVLARYAEPGSQAQPGRVLLALAAAGELRIEAGVDEKHLPLLQLGMPARAVADAFSNQPFDAQLSYIAPVVDAQRGTVEVRLRMPKPPAFLRPDMTVSVELLGGSRSQALVLSSVAVRDADRAEPWVLAVREGVAVRVPVRLGLRGVGSIEVVEGVREGEWVIAQTERVSPGDRVTVRPAAATAKGMETPGFIGNR